MMAQGKRDDR
jgi:hypothetical protein